MPANAPAEFSTGRLDLLVNRAFLSLILQKGYTGEEEEAFEKLKQTFEKYRFIRDKEHAAGKVLQNPGGLMYRFLTKAAVELEAIQREEQVPLMYWEALRG